MRVMPRPGNPRLAESGPRFPVPGRIGKRPVSRFPIPGRSGIGNSRPVSRPNRESGERELGPGRPRISRRVWSCRVAKKQPHYLRTPSCRLRCRPLPPVSLPRPGPTPTAPPTLTVLQVPLRSSCTATELPVGTKKSGSAFGVNEGDQRSLHYSVFQDPHPHFQSPPDTKVSDALQSNSRFSFRVLPDGNHLETPWKFKKAFKLKRTRSRQQTIHSFVHSKSRGTLEPSN